MGRGNWLPHTSDANYVYVHDVYEDAPESQDGFWYQEQYEQLREDIYAHLPECEKWTRESDGRGAKWDANGCNSIVRLATLEGENVAVGTYDDDVYVVVSVYPIVPEHISMYEPDEAEKMREKAVAKVNEIAAKLFDTMDEWFPLRRRSCAWTSSQYVRSDGGASKFKKHEVKLVTSTRYIQVKAVVEHPEDVDPEEVLSNCHYEFKGNDTHCTIKETELKAYSETSWD